MTKHSQISGRRRNQRNAGPAFHTWWPSDSTLDHRTVARCRNCGRLHIPTRDDPNPPEIGCPKAVSAGN